jgi:hypothetical protein
LIKESEEESMVVGMTGKSEDIKDPDSRTDVNIRRISEEDYQQGTREK